MLKIVFLILFIPLSASFSGEVSPGCPPEMEKAYEAITSPEGGLWVSRPVPRLYDSIPQDNIVAGNLEIAGNTVILSRPGAPSLIGKAQRILDPRAKSIYFDEANLRGFPSFVQVDGVVPLDPERGISLHLLMTLQQMKRAGIQYGTLKVAKTSSISNIRTCLELALDPAIRRWLHDNHPRKDIPNSLVADAILNTHTGKYIQTVLTQSGHRIRGIRATNTMTVPIAGVVKDEDRGDPRISRLLGQISPPDDWVPFSFKLEFDLEPF